MLGVIVMESKEAISARFTDSMVAQSIPTLGQLGVGNGRTGNDGLVVSKQPGRSIEGNSKGTKGALSCGSSAGSHKLTSIGYSFNFILSLGKPINCGLGNHM